MAMLKKKTKAAEKKAQRKDRAGAKEKEQSREAHKGKVSAKEEHRHGTHEGHPHAHAKKETGVKEGEDGHAKGTEAKAEKITATQDIAPSKMDIKQLEAAVADLDILKFPLVTEKAVNMIEAENKLTFIVAQKASKPIVKKAVEDLYKVKVTAVNIIRDMKARKRAIVTLDKKFKAADVATKLGVI